MQQISRPVLGVILRANRNIGSGHLMRIKPLLPLLKSHFKLHLYVYAFDENLRAMTQEYDEVSVFNTKEEILQHLLSLPLSNSSYLNKLYQTVSSPKLQVNEKSKCLEYLPDILLIDDYAIDRNFEEPLYAKTKVMVVDGLYDRYHTCHKILDITLFPEISFAQYQKLCNQECKILTGSKYSLTAQRFAPPFFIPNQTKCKCHGHFGSYSGRIELKNHKLNNTCLYQDSIANPLPRVFISFGGADPVSASLILTKTILNVKLYEQYCFTLVAGMSNSDYPQILSLINQYLPTCYADNFVLIKQCSDIADLLFRNDLAIGAYGGMTFERVTARIPTLGVVIADNQLTYRETCDKFEFGLSLELQELSDGNKVQQALSKLLENSTRFSQNCAQIYDGHGVENIAAEIISLLDE